jgi:hypothetical protein
MKKTEMDLLVKQRRVTDIFLGLLNINSNLNIFTGDYRDSDVDNIIVEAINIDNQITNKLIEERNKPNVNTEDENDKYSLTNLVTTFFTNQKTNL